MPLLRRRQRDIEKASFSFSRGTSMNTIVGALIVGAASDGRSWVALPAVLNAQRPSWDLRNGRWAARTSLRLEAICRSIERDWIVLRIAAFVTFPTRRRQSRAPIVSMEMSISSALTTSSRRTNEDAINAALATGELRSICRAVDAAVVRGGIAKVAQTAEVDRTTIYRAFRRGSGPALDTMVRVLRVLGLRLIVKIEPYPSSDASRQVSKTTARSLATAFISGDLDLAIEALARAVRSHDNVSELARATSLSRENLYRSFAFPRIPRFRTVLIFLNALGLRLGSERLPSKENGAASQPSAGRQAPRKGRRPMRADHLGRGTKASRGRLKQCAP
jgi:probable addiction module antidote protein